MRWEYLYDESEKTLAPFFSEKVMNYTFGCLVVTAIVLFVMWPRKPDYHFLEISQGPPLFFQLFSLVTILNGYIGLRCGRGEMVPRNYFSDFYEEPATFEKERGFMGYGFVGFMIHTAFIMFSFIPLLIIAAIATHISFTVFVKSLCVVYTSSLVCRLTGFVVYLLGGRSSYGGYFIARLACIFYLFATVLFQPQFNPIKALYALDRSMSSGNAVFNTAFSSYTLAAGILIALFTVICHLMIQRFMKSTKNDEARVNL